MANTYLTKTFASDSNRKTWTWSAWIKRSGLGGTQTLMTQVDAWNGNGNAGFYIVGDQLTSYNFTSSLNSGTDSYNRPSMFLRDVNGWYHIVVRLDTTQSTASNRCRWYVNGEQLTDFVYANYPSLNQDCNFNGGDPHGIGSHTAGANYFDGSMTHVHFTDGYSYDPSAFGETDATTGEWVAKTSPSVTYGTHGFLILKDGNTITDQSSNSNDFTLAGGTLTDLKDNPENVFATLNPLSGSLSNNTLTQGNNTVQTTSGWRWRPSTIAPSSGKYYAEFKPTSGSTIYTSIGVAPQFVWHTIDGETIGSGTGIDRTNGGYSVGYTNDGAVKTEGSSIYFVGSGYTGAGDIIGVAMDLDNHKVYFSKNGVWQNSGDPTSGSTGTGAVSLNTTVGDWSMSTSQAGTTIACNYGNGYFGTTAVSSAGTNASEIGIFEYDVPTGYTALSTKGLNE